MFLWHFILMATQRHRSGGRRFTNSQRTTAGTTGSRTTKGQSSSRTQSCYSHGTGLSWGRPLASRRKRSSGPVWTLHHWHGQSSRWQIWPPVEARSQQSFSSDARDTTAGYALQPLAGPVSRYGHSRLRCGSVWKLPRGLGPHRGGQRSPSPAGRSESDRAAPTRAQRAEGGGS